jgi:hypothetical protein
MLIAMDHQMTGSHDRLQPKLGFLPVKNIFRIRRSLLRVSLQIVCQLLVVLKELRGNLEQFFESWCLILCTPMHIINFLSLYSSIHGRAITQ